MIFRVPFAPIPTAELDHLGPAAIFAIRPVLVTFRPRNAAPALFFESQASNVLFARLAEAARNHETVTHFSQDGADLDGESLAALNCYLRTGYTMGRQNLPFSRLPCAGSHRYAWASFCEHLGLTFKPDAE